MPPKKKGAKNSSKPEWMSPELYDLSLNLPKLQVSSRAGTFTGTLNQGHTCKVSRAKPESCAFHSKGECISTYDASGSDEHEHAQAFINRMRSVLCQTRGGRHARGVEFWSGELKESKGKDKDKPQITITRTQVRPSSQNRSSIIHLLSKGK
eukprot:scaffold232853_cov15-Tisochrysis_lutea.AAC.1